MLEPMEYGDEMTPEIRKACFKELARRKYITAEVVYSGGHDEGGVDEIYATDELTQGEIPLTEEDPLFNHLASVVYATFGGFDSVPIQVGNSSSPRRQVKSCSKESVLLPRASKRKLSDGKPLSSFPLFRKEVGRNRGRLHGDSPLV